jgi:hypothetical protein
MIKQSNIDFKHLGNEEFDSRLVKAPGPPLFSELPAELWKQRSGR